MLFRLRRRPRVLMGGVSTAAGLASVYPVVLPPFMQLPVHVNQKSQTRDKPVPSPIPMLTGWGACRAPILLQASVILPDSDRQTWKYIEDPADARERANICGELNMAEPGQARVNTGVLTCLWAPDG